MTEDEMVGWHHQLNGHEFEQLWKMVKVEGNLACCRATEQQQGRIIPTILVGGVGVEISRNWATAHFLVFDCWLWNCHGTSGCVIYLADVLQ